MKKIKKVLLSLLAILGLITVTAASSVHADGDYTPKHLTVEFVPSSNAQKMSARVKPLAKLLEQQLHIPVTVTVSTNYNTIVEAMGSKKVDVGFLPPDAYVQAHKQYGVKVLLQAQRFGYKEPDDQQTNQLVNYYRAQIVVRKGSGIKNLKDLKGKKIAVQDMTSSSGWVFPVACMEEHGININKDHIQTVQVKGYDQAVMSVYNGNTDAAFIFQGARNLVKKDAPDVMQKVVPIYTTPKIPNDTISVRGDMSPAFQKKLIKAFQNIAKSKKGHEIISSVYQHEGYVPAKDSDFNTVRKYDKIVQKINQ